MALSFLALKMELEWLNERIKTVPQRKGFYTFIKIFLFKWKGVTYKDFYVILKTLYKNKKYDEKQTNAKAFNEILRIYEYNNNTLPKELNNG